MREGGHAGEGGGGGGGQEEELSKGRVLAGGEFQDGSTGSTAG